MPNFIKFLTYSILCSGLINGCALHTRYSPYPKQPIISWAARQTQLSQLSHWQAQGAILVHYDHNTWLGRFNWQTRQKHYDIQIKGPLGIGGVHIIGGAGKVWLYDGHRQPVASTTSPEQLLFSQLGWSAPVTPLQYWLLGLPDLKRPFQAQWDDANHLIQLQQSGWLIQFSEFSPVNSIDLPGRLILKRLNPNKTHVAKHSVTIKLAIHRWTLLP